MEIALAAIHRTSADFHPARARPECQVLVDGVTAPSSHCLGASVQPWLLCSACSNQSPAWLLWALEMCDEVSKTPLLCLRNWKKGKKRGWPWEEVCREPSVNPAEFTFLWGGGSGVRWEQGWGFGSWHIWCWAPCFILPHVQRAHSGHKLDHLGLRPGCWGPHYSPSPWPKTRTRAASPSPFSLWEGLAISYWPYLPGVLLFLPQSSSPLAYVYPYECTQPWCDGHWDHKNPPIRLHRFWIWLLDGEQGEQAVCHHTSLGCGGEEDRRGGRKNQICHQLFDSLYSKTGNQLDREDNLKQQEYPQPLALDAGRVVPKAR